MIIIGYLMMLFGILGIISLFYKSNKLRNSRVYEIEEQKCWKCGTLPIYIACPDHCYDCYIKYEWNDIEKLKPSHETVLAACNTYDCGWTIDSVWWDSEKEVWMTTGSVISEEAHLPYTHWRKMPDHPADEILYKNN